MKERAQALRPSSAPSLADDIGLEDLLAAIESHATFLSTLKSDTQLRFGKRTILASEYSRALKYLAKKGRTAIDENSFYSQVERDFDFFEVYGNSKWGEILLTSYFEPEISGSLKKAPGFSTPLLRRPADLVEVAASRFEERLADAGTLRGRLVRDVARQRDVLVPYFSRTEIESGVLKSRGLELCWVDPIDAFVMQIQGSGTVVLPDQSRLRLGYSDQNGQTYHSIGKFLLDIIPLEKMSLLAIESHLKSISSAEAQAVMNRNPSYVFFDKLSGDPITSLGSPVFKGRTLATDARYFPKGGLAFIKFKKPVFSSDTESEPSGWEAASRFVFDQDTGGAIRGGGRADLFWGAGAQAKRYAGFVKDDARLYYLLPKPELLTRPLEDELTQPPG